MSIAENLSRIQAQIAAACRRANRPESEVALMAVSKMHPAEAILEAHAAGQRLFGENRVQEWQSKFTSVVDPSSFANLSSSSSAPFAFKALPNPATDIEVHLIGPLQNNKTAKAAELFHAIDTLDSLKTAGRLNVAAHSLHKTLPILIEIKLSHEPTKHGLDPEKLPAFLAALAPLTNLQPSGLMTVPPWSEDAETARPYFQHLRRLRDENLAAHPTLTQLSMGMSNDFTVAIEEGSTTIRIGTAIFGKRTYT